MNALTLLMIVRQQLPALIQLARLLVRVRLATQEMAEQVGHHAQVHVYRDCFIHLCVVLYVIPYWVGIFKHDTHI